MYPHLAIVPQSVIPEVVAYIQQFTLVAREYRVSVTERRKNKKEGEKSILDSVWFSM